MTGIKTSSKMGLLTGAGGSINTRKLKYGSPSKKKANPRKQQRKWK
jgi:hypothetical protein